MSTFYCATSISDGIFSIIYVGLLGLRLVTFVTGATRILGVKDKKKEGGGKISRRRNSCGQVNRCSNESTEGSTRVPCGVRTYKVPTDNQHKEPMIDIKIIKMGM